MTLPVQRKIFVVDDHPMVRTGLRKLLEDSGRYCVAGEAATAAQALRQIPGSGAEGVIVDLMLGQSKRFDLIKSLRRALPGTPIVVLSMLERKAVEGDALDAGAAAFVEKSESPRRLLQALDGLFPSTSRSRPKAGLELLTPREMAVFGMLGEGLTKHDVASFLGISVKTVETYRESMKVKLGAPSVSDLIRMAVQARLRN